MAPSLSDVGTGVSALLAGTQPSPSRFGVFPWTLRGLLLIPALQVIGVAATLRRLRCWQRNPNSRTSRPRMWMLHILLPMIPNLLVVAAAIALWTSPLSGFLSLFAPDVSWIARICGSFALIWSVARTGLVVRGRGSPAARTGVSTGQA